MHVNKILMLKAYSGKYFMKEQINKISAAFFVSR